MRSQISSEAKKISKFDFKQSLRNNCVCSALALALLMILYPANAITELVTSPTDYSFVLTTELTDEFGPLIQIFLSAMGLLTAVFSFNFLNITKKLNVYLSFGISRKELFKNRVLAAVIKFSVVAVLPLLSSVIANLSLNEFSKYVIPSALYTSLGIFLLMFTGFSFGTIASVASGNIGENTVVSILGIASPFAVIYCLQYMLTGYLRGVPLVPDMFFYSFYNYFPVVFNSNAVDLPSALNFLDPLAFFVRVGDCSTYETSGLTRFGLDYAENPRISPGVHGSFIVFEDILPLIIWAVVGTLLIVFSLRIIRKRKAELAGSFGGNRSLNIVFASVVGFCAFALLSGIGNTVLSVVLGLAALVAVYLVFIVIITRSFSSLRKTAAFVAIPAGVSVLLTVILLTGCFGYTSYIPKAENIKRAYATLPVTDDFLLVGNYANSYKFNGYYFEAGVVNRDNFIGPFTDKNDIEKVIGCHKKAVENRSKDNSGGFLVAYVLDNGKTVTRCFNDVPVDVLASMCDLKETKFVDELTDAALDENSEDTVYALNENALINGKISSYEYQQISEILNRALILNRRLMLADRSFTLSKSVNDILTEEEISEFRKILASDLKKQTAKQRYMPEEKAVAVLFGIYEEERYDYDTDELWLYDMYLYSNCIHIYGYMTDTVAFLRTHGLLEFDTPEHKLVSADIKDMHDAAVQADGNNISLRHYAFSTNELTVTASTMAVYKDEYGTEKFGDISVTDEKTMNELYSTALSKIYDGMNCYAVRFVFSDGTYSIMYIPTEKMPKNLIDN